MKKIYQSPNTDVIIFSTGQLMTLGSNNYGMPEAGQDLDQVEETDQTSGNLSRRRRDVWDDEDLDDFE